MSLLHEAVFHRLLPKYERAFGGPLPFKSATVEEAVEYMQIRLRALSGPADQQAENKDSAFQDAPVAQGDGTSGYVTWQ